MTGAWITRIAAFVGCFALGGLLALSLREPPEPPVPAPPPVERQSVPEPASEPAPAVADAPTPSKTAPQTAKTETATQADEGNPETLTIWRCKDQPHIGLGYPGTCPVDDEPMVKVEVNAAELTDLGNRDCPVMGGPVEDDAFAVYHGQIVHFCCQGCELDFFAKPAEMLGKVGGRVPASDHGGAH